MARPWHPVSTALLAALCLAIPLLAPAAARALDDPYRLDPRVAPTRQSVHLRIDPDRLEYTGAVTFELRVGEPVPRFRFHAERMELTRIRLTGNGLDEAPAIERGEWALVTATPSRPLEPGAYRLEIEFTNTLGTQSAGLYQVMDGGRGYVFSQFEAIDAREAFPCWDEPGYKHPWQLTVSVPDGHEAVSNTPVERQNVEDGRRTYVFRETRPLPSYLIALAAGPLERVPIPGLSVPGHVYTVQGQSHLAGYAVETTAPLLAAFEEYFGERYPYPKLDLIAIPEFLFGAMENPGAITYASSLLLIDPAAASLGQKRALVRVNAHELAHQWFGDVVTMQWWDDLWLNETFADWLGDKIAHQVYPQFSLDVTELQQSLNVMVGDGMPSSQPIHLETRSTDNFMQNLFTQYNKGKAVLGMFEAWIGPETFQRGVRTYMERHRWGNAASEDFWAALADAAESVALVEALTGFIDQPGLPLIQVEPLGEGRFTIRQERYRNHGDETSPALSWTIPVFLRWADAGGTHEERLWLDGPSKTVTLPAEGEVRWVYPNAGQRGYYRWQLPNSMLLDLAAASAETLEATERLGLLANSTALLDAGLLSGDDYLRGLGALSEDPHPLVVAGLLNELGSVRPAFVPPELAEPFALYARRTLGPALERFGAEAREGEDEAVAILRPDLLSFLADEGRNRTIRTRAMEHARAYLEDPGALDPSLVAVMLRIAALDGDAELWEAYRSAFEGSAAPAERRRYLNALASFADPSLLERSLDYSLTEAVRPPETIRMLRAARQRPESGGLVFRWLIGSYDALAARVVPDFMGFMPLAAGGCSAERLERAHEFFSQPEHQAPGTEIQLGRVTDQVRQCLALREREGEAVAAYLHQLVGSR